MKGEKIIFPEHELFWKQWIEKKCVIDSEGLKIGDDYLMFFAERELMRKHAGMLIGNNRKKNLLEIGYGLGIFSEEAFAVGVNSYTIIEIHPELIKRAKNWRETLIDPDKVKIISKPWQLSLNLLKKYDAIMYDSCPPPGWDNIDFKYLIEILCKDHLKDGGLFSYFNIGPSVDPERAKILENYFRRIAVLQYEIKVIPQNWSLPTDQFLVAVYKKLATT